MVVAVLGAGQLKMAVKLADMLPRARFEEVALIEARHQFNGAGPTRRQPDPRVQTARAILALCATSSDLTSERHLHDAWDFLCEIGRFFKDFFY